MDNLFGMFRRKSSIASYPSLQKLRDLIKTFAKFAIETKNQLREKKSISSKREKEIDLNLLKQKLCDFIKNNFKEKGYKSEPKVFFLLVAQDYYRLMCSILSANSASETYTSKETITGFLKQFYDFEDVLYISDQEIVEKVNKDQAIGSYLISLLTVLSFMKVCDVTEFILDKENEIADIGVKTVLLLESFHKILKQNNFQLSGRFSSENNYLSSGSGNTHRDSNNRNYFSGPTINQQHSVKTETFSSENSNNNDFNNNNNINLNNFNSNNNINNNLTNNFNNLKSNKIRNLNNFINSNENFFEDSFLCFIEKTANMALPLFIKFLCELLNEPEMRTIFLLISSDDLSKIFNDLSKIRIIRKFTYDIFIKVNICTKEGLKLWNFRKYVIDNNCLEGILSAIKSNYFTSAYEDLNEIFRELNNLLIICAAFYETQKEFKNEIFNFLYKIFEDLLITSVNEETINDEVFYVIVKNFISEIFYLAYIDKDDLKPKLHENTLHSLISNKTLVNHTNNFKDFDIIEFLLTLFSNISEAANINLISSNNNNNNNNLNANININLNNYNSKEKLNNFNSKGSNNNNNNNNNQNNQNKNTNANTALANNQSSSLFEKTEFIRKIILTHLLDNDISLNKYKNIINNTNYCKIILENLHTYSEEMISYPFNSVLLIISEMGISGNTHDSQGNLPYSPEKEIKSILKNLLVCEDEAKICIILKHFKLFFDFYQANFQKLFISCGFLNILKDIFEQTINIAKINSDGGLLFANNNNNVINLHNFNSSENSSSNNGRSNYSTPIKKNLNEFPNLNNLNISGINNFNIIRSSNNNFININNINNNNNYNSTIKDFKEMKQPATPSLLIKLIEFLEIILHNNPENIQKYKSLFFLDNFFEMLTQFSDYKSVAYKIWNLTINFEQDEHEIIKYTKFLLRRYQILKETVLILNYESAYQIKSLLEEIFTINEIIFLCFKTDNYNKIICNVSLNMQFLKGIFLDFIDLVISIKNKITNKDEIGAASAAINSKRNSNPNSIIMQQQKNLFFNNNINTNKNLVLQNFEDFNINSNFFKAKIAKNENEFRNSLNYLYENLENTFLAENKNEFFDMEMHNLIKNYMKLCLGMIFKFNQTIFAIEFKSNKFGIPEGNNTRKFENFITKKDFKETLKKLLQFYNSLSDKKYLTDIVYYLAENSLKINMLEKKITNNNNNNNNNYSTERSNSIVSEKINFVRKISCIDEHNKINVDLLTENLCENLTLTFKEKYKLEEHELNNVYLNVSNYSNFILQSPFIIKIILKNIVKDLNNIKFLYDFIEFIYLLCQLNETNVKLLLKARIMKSLVIILEDEYFNIVLANKIFNNKKYNINNNNNLNTNNNSPTIDNKNLQNNKNNNINDNYFKDPTNNKNQVEDFIEDKNYFIKKEKQEILEKVPAIPFIQLDLIKTTLISKIMEIIDLCAKFFDKKDIDLFMEHLFLGFSKKKPNYSLLDRLINILKKNLKAAKKINKGIIFSALVTKQPSFYNMLYTCNLRLIQEKGSKDANKYKNSTFSVLLSLKFHRSFEASSAFTLFRLEREIKEKDVCALEAIIENGILKIKENEKLIPCEDLNNKNIFVELEKAYNIAFIISKDKNLLEVFINEKLKAAIPCEYKYLELNHPYNLITGYSCSTTREANYDNFGAIPHISFSYFLIYNEKLDPENLIFLKMSEILTGKNGSAAAHQIKRKNLKKKVFRILAPNYQHQKEKLKYIRIGIDPKKVLFEIIPDKINFLTNNQIMKLKNEHQNFCNNFIFKIQRKFFLDVTEKDFLGFIPNTNITNEDKAIYNNTFLLTKLNESDVIAQSQIFEISTLKNKIKEKVFNLNTQFDLEISASRFLDNFFSVLFECKENLCFNSLLGLLNSYMLGNIGEMVEFCDNKYLAIMSAILYKKNIEYKSLLFENDDENDDDNIDELDEEIQKIFKNNNSNNNNNNNDKSANNSSEGDIANDLSVNNLNKNDNQNFNINKNNYEKSLVNYLAKNADSNFNNLNIENIKLKDIIQNIYKENENEIQINRPFKKANSLKGLEGPLSSFNIGNVNQNRDSLEKFDLNVNLEDLEKEKIELVEKINIKVRRHTLENIDLREVIATLDHKDREEINPQFQRLIEISNILDKAYNNLNNNNNYNNNSNLNIENQRESLQQQATNYFKQKFLKETENKSNSFNNILNIEKQNIHNLNLYNQNDSSLINDNNTSSIFQTSHQINNNVNQNSRISGQINSIKKIATENNNLHVNTNTNINKSSVFPCSIASPNKAQIKRIIDSKTIEILFNFAFGTEDYEEQKLNFFNPLFPKIITEVIFDLNFFRKLDDKVKVYLIEKVLSFFNQSDYVFINSEINLEIKINILSKMFKILMLIPHQEEVDQFAISLIIVLLEQILKFKKGEFEPSDAQLKTVINCTQEFILIAGYFNDLITSHVKYRDFDQEQLNNTSDIIKVIFKKLFEEKTKVAREMILATFTKIWEDLSISQMGGGYAKTQEYRKSLTNSAINKLDNLLNPSFFLKLYNKEISNKSMQQQQKKNVLPSGSSKNSKTLKIDEELNNNNNNKRNRSAVKKKDSVIDASFASKSKKSKEKEKKESSRSKNNNNNNNNQSTNASNSKNSKNNSLEEKEKQRSNNFNNNSVSLKISNSNNINNNYDGNFANKEIHRNSKNFDRNDTLQQIPANIAIYSNIPVSKSLKVSHDFGNFDFANNNNNNNNYNNIDDYIRTHTNSNLNAGGVGSLPSNINNNSIFIYESPAFNPNLCDNDALYNKNNNNNNTNNLNKEKSANFNIDSFIRKKSSNINYNNNNNSDNTNNNCEAQQINNLINNSNIMSQNLGEFEDSMDYSEYTNNNNSNNNNNNNNNNNYRISEADFENETENNLDIEGECKGAECRLCNLIANLQQTYFNLVLKIQEAKKTLKKFFYHQHLKYYDKPAKILSEKQIEFSWFIFNHEGAARVRNKLIPKMNAIKNEELNKKFYGNGISSSADFTQKQLNNSDNNNRINKESDFSYADKKSNFEKIFGCFKIKKFVSQICFLDQIFRLSFIKNLINPNDEFISAYNCLIVEECHHIDAILIIGKIQFYILTNLHLDREGFMTYSKQKFSKTFWILNDYNDDWDNTCPYLNNSGDFSAAKLRKGSRGSYNNNNNNKNAFESATDYNNNNNNSNINKNLNNQQNKNANYNNNNLNSNNNNNFNTKELLRYNKVNKKKAHSQRRKATTVDESKMLKFSKMRKGFKFYSFTYDRINEIFKRRFLMKHNSLEIFLKTGRNFYLCFNLDKRESIFQHFVEGIAKAKKRENNLSNKIQINNLSASQLNSPYCFFTRNGKILIKKSKGKPQKNHKQIVDYKQFLEDIQDYWEKGVISNFNYLMILNTLAGRSYNDISQYLVMPWIIKDYSSEGLNLNNYETYRDLTRPIHAIDDNTYKNLSIKYSEADDSDKFHSGSHYSSPGFVCYFLIRLKPFAFISAEIQGGYFDIADRLFNNIRNLWDVNDKYQELIPEMFYFPELFVNSNEFDFGTNQNSLDVNDVILPSWSRGDPRLFAKMNKKALESSKVSEKLSDWIDLIFGVKQHGKEAVKALNVFRQLCYEGKIDFCKLEERNQEDKIVEIHDFGQVPMQLFSKHHNKREKHLNSAAFFSKLHFLIHFKEKEKSVNLSLENFPENLKFYCESESYLSNGEGAISSFLMSYDNEEKSAKFNDASNTLILAGHKKFLIGPKFVNFVDFSFSKFAFAICCPLYKISFVFNTFRSAAITSVKATCDGKRLVIAFDDGVLRVYRIFYDKKDRVFHPEHEKKKDKGFFGLFSSSSSKKDGGASAQMNRSSNANHQVNYNNSSNYNNLNTAASNFNNNNNSSSNNNYNFGNNNFDNKNFNYNYNYNHNNNNNYNANINNLMNMNSLITNTNHLFATNYNYNTNASNYNNNFSTFNSNLLNNTTIGPSAANMNSNNNQYLMTQSTVTGLNNSFIELNNFLSEKDLRDYLSFENFNNGAACAEKVLYPMYKFNSSVSEFKDFQIFYNNCNHELSKSNSKGAKNITLKFIKENKFFENEIKIVEICECFSLLVGIDILNTLYICELNKFEVVKIISLNKVLPKIDEIIHVSIDSSSGDFVVVSSLFVVLFNLNGVILAVLDLKEYPKLSKITTALIKSIINTESDLHLFTGHQSGEFLIWRLKINEKISNSEFERFNSRSSIVQLLENDNEVVLDSYRYAFDKKYLIENLGKNYLFRLEFDINFTFPAIRNCALKVLKLTEDNNMIVTIHEDMSMNYWNCLDQLQKKSKSKTEVKVCPQCNGQITSSKHYCAVCKKKICSQCKIVDIVPEISLKSPNSICNDCFSLISSTNKLLYDF